ncbi:MAG: single-stranded DNA-binding protein [Magnetococcus sp. DMHC-8]
MPEPAVVLPAWANHVVLEGTLAAAPEFRVTPAGRLVAHLHLEHLSQGRGTEQAQRLELRLPVLALGPLAERCRLLSQGTLLHVEGSLNQKRWVRDGKVRWGVTELLACRIGPAAREPIGTPEPSSGI